VHTVGVTGFAGGKLKELAKMSVHVPLNDMCTSESIHSVIFHYVALELQKRLYDTKA
jgi:D-sedoheptulose 7-phosphate isomerase